MNTIKKITLFDKVHFVSLSILIFSSIFHRMELNTDYYTSSIFIPFEMIFTTSSFLYVFFIPFVFIIHLFKKNFLMWKFISWFITIITINLAMTIDSPTLVYMT